MSKADKMFEKLGYEKFDNHSEECGINEWTTHLLAKKYGKKYMKAIIL